MLTLIKLVFRRTKQNEIETNIRLEEITYLPNTPKKSQQTLENNYRSKHLINIWCISFQPSYYIIL